MTRLVLFFAPKAGIRVDLDENVIGTFGTYALSALFLLLVLLLAYALYQIAAFYADRLLVADLGSSPVPHVIRPALLRPMSAAPDASSPLHLGSGRLGCDDDLVVPPFHGSEIAVEKDAWKRPETLTVRGLHD